MVSAGPAVFSGPQTGERLPPLPVLAMYGAHDGTNIDPVELCADKPLLLVFVHNRTRPSTDLARVLMHFCAIYADQGLVAAQIVLDPDRTAIEQHLRFAKGWWDTGTLVGVSLDGAEGPGSYGLNRNVELTVLVANKSVVTANFPLIQPSLTDAPRIIEELGRLVTVEIPTTPEIEFLQAHSNELPIPHERKNGKGPHDPKLRELLCKLLRVQADPQAVGEAAKAVEEYVGDDKNRQTELRDAAILLLDHTYGGRRPIIERAGGAREVVEAWRKRFAP